MIETDIYTESLFEKAQDYGETTMELMKLKAINKSADVFSSMITTIAITAAVVSFALLFSIGMALWIGHLLGESYYGFFVVAGFYGLVASVLYLFRRQWIKTPVSDFIIGEMLNGKQS